jgi:hypothetical protein
MDVEPMVWEAEETRLTPLTRRFLHSHVGEEETAIVRRLVLRPVTDGKMKENTAPTWSETLRGKAPESIGHHEERMKPPGYPLKAMVINLPRVPGDIGFFLDWAPRAA